MLWFTNDASKVRSNNLRVLQPHSDQHLKLQAAGGENRHDLFMVMGRTSLKAVPLEIKQKERSPRILCFTAIAALIRDFAIPLPASSVFRCTVQRLLPGLQRF
ncbi:hypothetical protein ACLB1R_35755 [Escherichia coli]